MSPLEQTVLSLSRAVAAGHVDPVDLLEEALERAKGPAAVHAFITVTAHRARREGRRSAERHRGSRSTGPLDGVPIAWKDLVDMAGTPTSAGSATRLGVPAASADAAIVRHASAAGMVTVGKTNLSEFAFSGLGTNRHFGTPRNPVVAGAVPGGSSSGSAVAVAAGVVPCAVGTDTSGSVRVPAAICGLVGWRPTTGRIPRAGVLPLAPTLDSVGPITRTVSDAVSLDAVLRGGVPPSATHLGTTAPLIVPAGALTDQVDGTVADVFHAAVERLGRAGWRLHRRAVPDIDAVPRAFDRHGTLVAAEAYRTHASTVDGPAAHTVDPRILRRFRQGRSVLRHGYRALLARRATAQRAAHALLHGRCLIYPTVPVPAPPVTVVESDSSSFAQYNRQVLSSTMIGSFLDLPSITLPAGLDGLGRPVGLSISGAPGTDDHVLAVATAVERSLDQ